MRELNANKAIKELNISYAPINHNHDPVYLKLTGGHVQGRLQDTFNAGTTLDGTLYQKLSFEARSSDGGPSGIGFHRTGKTAIGLYTMGNEAKNILRVRTSANADYDIYHSGNKPTAAEIGAALSSHSHSFSNINLNAFTGGNDLNTYNPDKTWIARTINTTTNRPLDYYSILNIGAPGNSNGQLAWNYNNAELDLRFRKRHDTTGNYGEWRKIFHSGSGTIGFTTNVTMGQTHKQVSEFSSSTIAFTNYIEGNPYSASMGLHNRELEFYGDSFNFYPTSSYYGVTVNGKFNATEGTFGEMKAGCIIGDSLESKMDG